MNFQLVQKILKNKDFILLKCSYVSFILLINIHMSTVVGILTFLSKIIFTLSMIFLYSSEARFTFFFYIYMYSTINVYVKK